MIVNQTQNVQAFTYICEKNASKIEIFKKKILALSFGLG